ncbi:MAG TPA: DUF2142 domain-containing protein, partial [Bacteroidales bacterium]|nr:DUF2142 domain-containing protein [Bacteroidales bacterium]
MKKYRNLIFSLLFLIPALLFTMLYRPVRSFFPAQQVELSHGVEYGAVIKGFLFVQEIILHHRYLDRVDLYMAKLPSRYPNENVFLLMDEQHRILFTRKFSSDDFGEALYFPFDLKKPLDIGKGRKVLACIYSIDGSQESYIGLAKKENGTIGRLSVVTIVNNDITGSVEKNESLVTFTGCIGARTFESDSRFFSLLQVILYVVSFLVAVLIFFGQRMSAWLKTIRIKPERAFLAFAVPFGLLFLVLTPPFMVPDEPVHFYRAYQVSEFNFYKLHNDFPSSLVELGAICNRMQFSTHEKTTRREILSLGDIRLNPGKRTSLTVPDYTFPYLPQAAGIALGRMAGLTPLWMFYLGRFFNLALSLFLLFLAIRTTPSFRWIFFMLAVMPMNLFQVASLSYDAVTTGLSFLFVALILRYLAAEGERIGGKGIARILAVAAMLAAAKQPYAVVALTFFLLPVSRFGSLRRYLTVAAGLFGVVAIVALSGIPGRVIAQKLAGSGQATATKALAWVPGDEKWETSPGHRSQTLWLPQQPHEPEAINPIDPAGQKKFILEHPARFIGILYNTLGHSLDLYLTSLVGLFGWIDTPLPPWAAYLYVTGMVLLALSLPVRGMRLYHKMLLAGIFITGYVLVETALYVYCNPVGCDPITAIQGRYFIALAPLFFLLLGN